MADHHADNVLIVHWHDTGRWLGAYGRRGVHSPRLDRLAAESILFTNAFAVAPQCSPSRGALFTGRYPHSNGLIGLAHHGFEYRRGVRTLPQILHDAGWYSALVGMQHETSHPARLGFDEFDVSDAHCDHVVSRAQEWLADRGARAKRSPWMLTAGFFETHRPWPHDRYAPAPLEDVTVPDYLPDLPQVRADIADFYGAIAVADAAVGRLLDALAADGLDRNTWVVFFSDHGAPFPRAKGMLYDAGTEIALIVRPPTRMGVPPRRYHELFSGVDLVPTLLELLRIDIPPDVEGLSHARNLLSHPSDTIAVRNEVFTEKTFHDTFDPIRAIRTDDFCYIENLAPRQLVDLPRDIADSPSGQAVASLVTGPRPVRELYDLTGDPAELDNLLTGEITRGIEELAEALAVRLHVWREAIGDVCPSDLAGRHLLVMRTASYVEESQLVLGLEPTDDSPLGLQRGMRQLTG
ncbi:sulfatase [Mycobacterium sp. NPDC050551]|uniref:sulfatase family protein n=1 Tax=Mycobacterium sp. NPDC050551 TaxID=3155407 RepID=UPI00341298BD